jgi:hypothetical protein
LSKPAVTERIKLLTRLELANPSGAYDQITSDGRHPLAHLVDDEPFFSELARRAKAEIDRPTGKYGNNHREVAEMLHHPVLRRLAQDGVGSVPKPAIGDQTPDMPTRGFTMNNQYQTGRNGNGNMNGNGDQEGDVPCPSAEELLSFVSICMNKLPGDEQGKFVEGLANMLSQDPTPWALPTGP